jgi:hypothetical protein
MRDSSTNNRDFAHVPPGSLHAFADSFRHLTRPSHPNAYATLIISNHNHGPETKAPPPFDHLGRASDINYSLVEFLFLSSYKIGPSSGH